jgi:hypothetical protein
LGDGHHAPQISQRGATAQGKAASENCPLRSRRFVSNDASLPHFSEIAAGGSLRPFDGETMATQPEGKTGCNGAAASDRLGG